MGHFSFLDVNLFIFHRQQSSFIAKTQSDYFQANGSKRTIVQTIMIFISLSRNDNNSQRNEQNFFFPFIPNLFYTSKKVLTIFFSKRPLNVHFFFEDCYNLFCDKIWMRVPFIFNLYLGKFMKLNNSFLNYKHLSHPFVPFFELVYLMRDEDGNFSSVRLKVRLHHVMCHQFLCVRCLMSSFSIQNGSLSRQKRSFKLQTASTS